MHAELAQRQRSPFPRQRVAVGVPSSPAIDCHSSATTTGPMPTTSHVYVHADSTSGVLASPITQDSALLLTQPAAGDDYDAMADDTEGLADAIPPVLNSVFDCPKLEENVSREGRIGWRCHWCGKWFAGRHSTRALMHVLRTRLKKALPHVLDLSTHSHRAGAFDVLLLINV